jgi:hypothetical protein
MAIIHDHSKWVPITMHGISSGCGWRIGLQIWRVAVNISNKQSPPPTRVGPPALGFGKVITTPHHYK